MPTYSSSGYDWDSALDIWFDSIASGSLGSLHCFDGDENGEKPSAKHIAKFNGLNSLVRKEAFFSTKPVHAKWQGIRAGLAPSWERIENGKIVLLALRTHLFDGKPAPNHYSDILETNITLVVAALDDKSIAASNHIGIVPFGDGCCTLKHNGTKATVTEHYLSGNKTQSRQAFKNEFTLDLQQSRGDEVLEWIEIILAKP